MSEPESAALSAALSVLCDSRRRRDEERELPAGVLARRALERYYHSSGQILARFEGLGECPGAREELREFLRQIRVGLVPYKMDIQRFIFLHTRRVTEIAGVSEFELGMQVLAASLARGGELATHGLSLVDAAREKLFEMVSLLKIGGGEDDDDEDFGPDMGCAAWLIDPPTGGAAREAKPFPPEGFEARTLAEFKAFPIFRNVHLARMPVFFHFGSQLAASDRAVVQCLHVVGHH